MATRDLLVRIVVDLNKFTQGIGNASKHVKDFTNQTADFSKKHTADIKKAGIALTAFAGTAAFALKKASGVALDYEEQMARVETMLRDNVNTATNEVVDTMANFDVKVKSMATEFGQSTKTLSDGLYNALSAGNDATESIELLEEAAKIAAGQFTETGTVIEVLLTTMEAYGDEISDVTHVSDMLSNTVFLARTEMGALAQQAGNFIPIGKQLGIPLNDLLALFAQLTLSLGSTERATTTLSGIMNTFTKPQEQAKKAFAELTQEALGYSAELSINTVKQLGFGNILKLISGASVEHASALFGSQEALKGLDVLMSKSNETMQKSAQILNDRGTAQNHFNNAQDKTFFKIQQTEQKIKVALIDTFSNSLPIIEAFTMLLGDMAAWFSKLSPATKRFIASISVGSVAVAAVSAGLLSITLLLPKLVAGFAVVKGAVIALNAHVFLLAGSVKALLAVGLLKWLGAVAAAFAVGWGIGKLLTQFDALNRAIQTTIEYWTKLIGLDFSKPAADVAGLSKRLDEINKKYGIQAKSAEEALKIIKERNAATREALESDKPIDSTSLIERVKKLKATEQKVLSKEEKKNQDEILKLKRQLAIESLEVAGKEKDAKLLVLLREFEERKKVLGDDLELERWYQNSRNAIEKEYADKKAEKRQEQLVELEQEYVRGLNLEKSLIENIGFSWAGYYDWKKQRIEDDFLETLDNTDNKEAAERVYQNNLKKLDIKKQEHAESVKEKELDALIKHLESLTEANEDYYKTISEIAQRTGQTRTEVINMHVENVKQNFNSALEGMHAASEEFVNEEVNLYQMSHEIIQDGYTSMIDGMSDLLSEFIEGAIRGNVSMRDSFNAITQDMARSFIQAVSRMIVKALILKAIQGMTGTGAIPLGAEKGGLIPALGYQSGGSVLGASGPGDNVRANLKGGEFVVRKEAVNSSTLKQLARINKTGRTQTNTPQVQTGDIVNFIDPSLFQNYIAKNPDAITNVVSADAAGGGRVRSSLRKTL